MTGQPEPSTPPERAARLAHLDLQGQIEALLAIVQKNDTLQHALAAAKAMELPGWYVGAGCVTQSVWNFLTEQPLDAHVKDIDLVYFDPDTTAGKELEAQREAQFRSLLGDVSFEVDVKNQARVHLWYADTFGYSIPPYTSTEAAIATWPTTASSLGVRASPDGWKICAPFGLHDLFGMIVRPNKAQITEVIYQKKVQRWKACWPALTIIPWSEA